MSKRTSTIVASTGVSKSPRTNIISSPQVTQSPYFADQDIGVTCNTHTNINKNENTNKGDGEENKTAMSAETVNQGTSSGVICDPKASPGISHPPRARISQDFYNQDSITLAKALLGQVVVRLVEGVRISGRIVETESYLGGPDVASHSYNNKRTPRNEPMYMKPGTSYVYVVYGMYHCFNISSKGEGSCVLIRSLEPLEGLEKMQVGRSQRRKPTTLPTPLKLHFLCNGPSKLCQALYLSKDSNNKVDLAKARDFWLERGSLVPESIVVVTKRVGINGYGKEWADKPLRFYQYNSKFVSVRDKVAEGKMLS